MRLRTYTGWFFAVLLAVPAVSMAEDPRGRARTWDIEANIGVSVIDTGFDRWTMGYNLFTPAGGSSKVPPTKADHLETDIPTVGVRAGYSFTRAFALELGTVAGRTEVGDGTIITLQEDFTRDQVVRQTVLRQQTATAPQILAAYNTLEFDYSNTDLSAVFKFNNHVRSKWVFYGTLGGGYFVLNPNSDAYNNCNGTPDNLVFDPSVSKYNGDPNLPSGRPPGRDMWEDNPQQLAANPGCGRAFLVGTEQGVRYDPATQSTVPNMFIGAVFRDTVPVLFSSTSTYNCPAGQTKTVDADTQQIFCDGNAQWVVPPGTLNTVGYSTTGKVNGFEQFFYSLGAGVRWHFKPRHVLRIDARRSFIEAGNQNKNANQVTVGYSFVLGRGKPDQPGSAALPPPDDIPPPDDGEEGVPPPAEPDGDGAGVS